MKKFLLIGLISVLLSGCSILIDFNDILNDILSNEVTNSTPSNNVITSTSVTTLEKDGDINTIGLSGEEYLDYYSQVSGCEYLPSVGNPKMLVVPVLFKDTTASSLIKSSSQVLSDLDKAFNGTSNETGWESVSSFYNKSSYGKLDIDADVLDYWITLDKTILEIMSLNGTQYLDPTWYVVDYVVNYLKNQGMDMKKYDTNSDGFIDGIWLIYGSRNYTNANSVLTSNFLWAYTFWQNRNVPLKENPTANVYCWGSYDFMYETSALGSPLKIDAHTYIHETGHMLGLEDYYDYDEYSTISPAGCLDMMDYNIGDHNAYSKYMLGWIEPKVFDFSEEGGVYSLEPFESSGDAFIIPCSNKVNSSALEEYLIVEFYTPTGLNELDATYQYSSKHPKMFTKPGIKIYHVDARLGKFKYQGDWKNDCYIRNFTYQDLINETGYFNYFAIFASNTPSRSFNRDFKLLNLISSRYSSSKYYYNRTYATNNDLFIRGDMVKKFNFNDGSTFNYDIVINYVGEKEARLIIE